MTFQPLNMIRLILADPELVPAEKVALTACAICTDNDSGAIVGSQRRVGRAIGVERQTVSDHMRKDVVRRYFETPDDRVNGRRLSWVWRPIGDLQPDDRAVGSEPDDRAVGSGSPVGVPPDVPDGGAVGSPDGGAVRGVTVGPSGPDDGAVTVSALPSAQPSALDASAGHSGSSLKSSPTSKTSTSEPSLPREGDNSTNPLDGQEKPMTTATIHEIPLGDRDGASPPQPSLRDARVPGDPREAPAPPVASEDECEDWCLYLSGLIAQAWVHGVVREVPRREVPAWRHMSTGQLLVDADSLVKHPAVRDRLEREVKRAIAACGEDHDHSIVWSMEREEVAVS